MLIVDLQKDFLPGGALAVSQGDRVVAVMNRYIALFRRHRLPVVATRDWHPVDHCSFQTQGGPWPEHCIAGTKGAEFSDDLQLPEATEIFSTGVQRNAQGYSGFENTELEPYFSRLETKRLFIGGLATDYCILHTVLDACARRYSVYLLKDAIRAVDVAPQNGRKAIDKMIQQGALLITLADIQ